MTRLDCSVVNCIYNTDHCCGKGDIMVEGSSAKTSRETCCSSFKEKREGSAGNSCSCSPKEDIKVNCKAKNCKFNDQDDCRCTADHIGIAGGNACHCTDTECASFCCE